MGSQSRLFEVGARVYRRAGKNDRGTVTEKGWAKVTVKWESERALQRGPYTDGRQIERLRERLRRVAALA